MRAARSLVALSCVVLAACSGSSSPGAHPASAPPTTAAPTPVTTSPPPETVPPPTAAGPSVTTVVNGVAGPCTGEPSPPPTYQHVVWIWMENHRAEQVLDPSAGTPFEQGLARECGSTRTYRAVGSPSLPNYIAATSGDTQRIHDDGSPSAHPVAADNLFRQVRQRGGTARSYEEAMTGTCGVTSGGRYATKHNPQAYFVGPGDRAACQRDDVPLGTLSAGPLHDDLAAGRLPTFAFVTPDLCDDTHDCDVAAGDRWLADWIGLITTSPTFRAGSTVLFVVWDEPTPMPMLVVAPAVRPGASSTQPWDHYSLLRTTEELLGIPDLLGHATTASSMRAAYGL